MVIILSVQNYHTAVISSNRSGTDSCNLKLCGWISQLAWSGCAADGTGRPQLGSKYIWFAFKAVQEVIDYICCLAFKTHMF